MFFDSFSWDLIQINLILMVANWARGIVCTVITMYPYLIILYLHIQLKFCLMDSVFYYLCLFPVFDFVEVTYRIFFGVCVIKKPHHVSLFSVI